jgi:diacylglycerol kinase family enzyme
MATFRSLQFGPFLGMVASVLRRGSYFRRHRSVDYRTDLAAATVTGHGPFPYQVDGDHLGDAERLEFRHEPDALTIVVP